jgi:hypothetical protein
LYCTILAQNCADNPTIGQQRKQSLIKSIPVLNFAA